MQLRTRYGAEFSKAMSDISPEQTLDNDFMIKARAAREAIPFNVAWQATSTITVVSALVSMILLAISLWGISPIAAVLISLALIPDLIAYSRVAGVENEVWQEVSAVGRRIDYLDQLQDFAPSSTELAKAHGGFGIAEEVSETQQKFALLWNKVPRASLRLSLIASTVVFLLALVSIWTVAGSGIGPEGIAAAMLGIVSGLSVTRSVGAAFGELMASTPLVIAYKKTLESLHLSGRRGVLDSPIGIEVDDVTFTYPGSGENEGGSSAKKSPALSRVTCTFSPGSMVALVGENGSGKTSLVKLIAGITSPDSGQVRYTGSFGNTSDIATLRDSSSLVFQDYTRFEVKLRDFVDPTRKLDDDVVREGLIRARAWDFVSSLPNGTQTMLGSQWRGEGLSGGQWQRLVIARTFLSQSPVWILDEPTSAVDAVTEAAIYRDVIRERPKGTTVIVISHRPEALREVDQILVMKDGHVVEQGAYRDLCSAGGEFERLSKWAERGR
ncbi:MAG: ABC transporter ATP-binding protein [Actinomycetaceae bacterium]|nr:ABC transporter ATP-binding protein [Actinomycetaceae bacterium]